MDSAKRANEAAIEHALTELEVPPPTLEAAERWFGVADAWGGPKELGVGG